MSSLMVYNKTASPVTLAGTTTVVPASSDPPLRGQGVNVTSKLKNLTKAQYLALETQRQSAGLDYSWTDNAEYTTDTLQVSEPAVLRQKNRKNAWQGVMTKGDEIHLAVCNASERVSDGDAQTVARILEIFLKRYFCPSWGMRPPSVQFYSDWSLVPKDSRTFICLLLNDAIPEDDGEAGFHTQFDNRVIARVSCQVILNGGGGVTGVDPQAFTAYFREDYFGVPSVGASISYVACVEVCEALVDGMVNQWSVGPTLIDNVLEYPASWRTYPYGNTTPANNSSEIAMWLKEANDPVEFQGFYIYDDRVGAGYPPYGGKSDAPLGLVPNFVLPAWFNIRSPFYVADVEPVNATADITLVPGSQLVDGDYFSFTQPSNFVYGEMETRVKIVFTNDPEPPWPDYPANPADGIDVTCHIPFTNTSTKEDLWQYFFNSTYGTEASLNLYNVHVLVKGAGLFESEYTDPMVLMSYVSGTAYNVPVTENVTDAGFLVTNFTGGVDFVEGVYVPVDFIGTLPGPFTLAPGGGIFTLQGDAVEYVVEGRNSKKGKGMWPKPMALGLSKTNRYKFKCVQVKPYRTKAQKLATAFSPESRRIDSHGLRSRVTIRTLTDQ